MKTATQAKGFRMRKIKNFQILIFSCLIIFSAAAAVYSSGTIAALVFDGNYGYKPLFIFILSILIFYIFTIAIFRAFLRLFPLKKGDIERDSKDETVYHVYILFFIMCFYPLMRSGFLPFPLLKLLYLCLGAKMGDNSFTGGIIHDPIFVKIGSNCILGQGSLLVPHQIEGEKLSHQPIIIGDNCTIGALSIIFQDVKIGNNSIVAASAVVTKGTIIGDDEIWGGIPAKFIKKNLPTNQVNISS